MEDSQIQTKSEDVKVKCPDCSLESDFMQCLKEREVVLSGKNLFQVYMVCPHCSRETHSYYTSRLLRVDQRRLSKAVFAWNKNKNNTTYVEYERRHRIFQHNFDSLQKQCRVWLQEQMPDEQANT